MISKNRDSIQISQVRKPIQIISSITMPGPHDQSISYFIISTIDNKVIIVQIDHRHNNLLFKYSIVEVSNVVTAMWQQQKTSNLWFGCANGDIIMMKPKLPNILTITNHIKQQNPCLEKSIVLLYLTNQYFLTFNIKSTINFYNPVNLDLVTSYSIPTFSICASLTFLNPYNSHIVSCIAFNTATPPLILDCESPQQFGQAMKTCLQIYEKEQCIQSEVVCMADRIQLSEDQQIVIMCGMTDHNKNKNYVVMYQLKQHANRKTLNLQKTFQFQVKYQILHISVKDGLAMISMYNQLLFFDVIQHRKQLLLSKVDLAVTLGFVLQRQDKQIKFMANKGFSYLLPQQHKEQKLKLRIRNCGLKNQIQIK